MKARIIYNALAGRAHGEEEIQEAQEYLRSRGWDVDWRPASREVSPTDLARQAVGEGCDAVIAAGGDGTINQVLQALATTDVVLGVIPLGTGNAWARQIGVPQDSALSAITAQVDGTIRTIDLGRAGDRYFLLMAGVGFDAEVLRHVNRQQKQRWGILAYWMAGFRLGVKWRGVPVTLEFDGERRRYRVVMMVISNSRLYGGTVEIAYRASLDDGLLDVTLMKGSTLLHPIYHLIQTFFGGRIPNPEMEYLQLKRVTVHSGRALAVQVDGDLAGETPMTFSVAPAALRVFVPSGVPRGIFAGDTRQTDPRSPAAVLQQLREATRRWRR